VQGRAFQLSEWYGGKRSIRIKRHLKRTSEAKAYGDKSERELICSALLAESKQYHAISTAMSVGKITIRKKQRKQIKSLCSGIGKTKTSIRLEVAKLIGCLDKLKVGDGMVTAMERADDELGMTVEGVIIE
jgi:hypothetical protein